MSAGKPAVKRSERRQSDGRKGKPVADMTAAEYREYRTQVAAEWGVEL